MSNHKLYFLIGASGAGKTTVVKCLESQKLSNLKFYYSDSVGIPSKEEMINQYGSTENWQEENTKQLVKKIKNQTLDSGDALLDIQSRPSFIIKACEQNNVINYEIILFDCSDQERKRRLTERKQPELANEQMMNWGNFLRTEAKNNNYKIFDTTGVSIKQSTESLKKHLTEKIIQG